MEDTRTTQLYLINCPLDSENNHTYHFDSLTEQVKFFHTIKQKYLTQYSYIRKENKIVVNIPFDEITAVNYLVYKNVEISDKWYFAFVKEMKYLNDNATEIIFEIDVLQTYMFDYSVGSCFIEREHVLDDSIGANTIPEAVETGEYVSCNLQPSIPFSFNHNNCCAVLAVSEIVVEYYSTANYEIPGGLYYIGCTTDAGLKDLIKLYSKLGKMEAIASVFIAPKKFFTRWDTWSADGTELSGNFSTSLNFEITETLEITKTNYLNDNYKPKNKKLLCYPYSYLQVSNNSGQIVNYRWEEFNKISGQSKIQFNVLGTISPGCSIKAYPIDYKNILNNYDESITLGKLPIGSWSSDVYTNWLTQNSVNLGIQMAGSIASGVAGIAMIATGAGAGVGVGMLGGAVLGVANSLSQAHQHSMIPDQVNGNTNTGDVNYQFDLINLTFKRMSIKNEYAQVIDEYFSMYGYKVNRVKIPNRNHRQAYWFTKTIDANISGNLPQNDLQKIINCYNKGITFWKKGAIFRNYTQSNNIA